MSTQLQNYMPFWVKPKVVSPNWVACQDQHGVALMSAWWNDLNVNMGFDSQCDRLMPNIKVC